MLVDNIKLHIKAGNGGDGAVSFLRNRMTAKGGPDGGNGGNGGDIYVQGSSDANDLRQFRSKKKILAPHGVAGKRKNLFGKNASSISLRLPFGTRITDTDSGAVIEIVDTVPILIARGGKGGRGNREFRSATNQTPLNAEKGVLGQEKNLFLELRLIADIGLIGLTNAGKSSLLSVLTHATPKVGNYPFTTLEPNIGMFNTYTIADIPGLIEGASKGKGLGISFLKHIEKTKVLVHCIEVTGENVENMYDTVRSEFERYNSSLLDKPEIILLTKIDLMTEKNVKKKMQILKKKNNQILTCSIYDQKSLDTLKQALEKLL